MTEKIEKKRLDSHLNIHVNGNKASVEIDFDKRLLYIWNTNPTRQKDKTYQTTLDEFI